MNRHPSKRSYQRTLLLSARVISLIFTPFYLPLVGMVVLFYLSYLRLLPWDYKLKIIALVCFFTILLPTLFIRFYRHYHGWTLIELGARERRMVPYVFSIVCYFTCVYLMEKMHIPHFMGSIVTAALMVQIVCALVNVSWKISTHTAAIGGLAGALIVFSMVFNFNPVWWFCLVLVVAGLLGSSRMVLLQHTLPQVVAGFFVGFACAFLAIIYL